MKRLLALLPILALTGCVPVWALPSLAGGGPALLADERLAAHADVVWKEYAAAFDRARTTFSTAEIDQLATGDALAVAHLAIDDLEASGLTMTGESRVEILDLVNGDLLAEDADAPAWFRGCLDESSVAFVEPGGLAVTGGTPEPRSMLVAMVEGDDGRLLVGAVHPSDSDPFCGESADR